MNSFLHSGHIGDIIAFLPIMKKLGGGRLVVTDHPDSNPQMKGFRYDSVEPLLAVQSYIQKVEYQEHPTDITFNGTRFRRHLRKYKSLLEAQSDEYQTSVTTEPWIECEADKSFNGRVVVCRSPRYRNEDFPWGHVMRVLGGRAIFIGVDEEYDALERIAGRKIERYQAGNCLKIAQAIKGSDYFIGNQSSPFWIAAGMNHPLIQETFINQDSIVVYPNAQYRLDKELLDLDDFDCLFRR